MDLLVGTVTGGLILGAKYGNGIGTGKLLRGPGLELVTGTISGGWHLELGASIWNWGLAFRTGGWHLELGFRIRNWGLGLGLVFGNGAGISNSRLGSVLGAGI